MRLLALYERELKAVPGVAEASRRSATIITASPRTSRPSAWRPPSASLGSRRSSATASPPSSMWRGQARARRLHRGGTPRGIQAGGLHRGGGFGDGRHRGASRRLPVLGFTGTHPHPGEQALKLLGAGREISPSPAWRHCPTGAGLSSRRLKNSLTLHCNTSIWAMSLVADAGIREAHLQCSRSGQRAKSRTYLSRG